MNSTNLTAGSLLDALTAEGDAICDELDRLRQDADPIGDPRDQMLVEYYSGRLHANSRAIAIVTALAMGKQPPAPYARRAAPAAR